MNDFKYEFEVAGGIKIVFRLIGGLRDGAAEQIEVGFADEVLEGSGNDLIEFLYEDGFAVAFFNEAGGHVTSAKPWEGHVAANLFQLVLYLFGIIGGGQAHFEFFIQGADFYACNVHWVYK